MLLHLGLWLQRGKPEILFPRLSLGLFMLEVVVLVVGGYAWGWQDFLLGLVAPVGVVAVGYTSAPYSFCSLPSKLVGAAVSVTSNNKN